VEGRGITTLYEDAKKKEERLKTLKTKIETKGFQPEVHSALESSNKYMLKKFLSQYNDALDLISQERVEKINLYQLIQFFEALKLVSLPDDPNQLESPKRVKEGEFNPNLIDNTFRQQEKKLITQIWENLKDDEGNINTNHLFLFLLAILNLYEFYLYSSYKKAQKPELALNTEGSGGSPKNANQSKVVLTEGTGTITDFNNNLGSGEARAKTQGNASAEKKNNRASIKQPLSQKEKDQEKDQILNKIQADISSKIKISKKYCSFDNENVFILSFNNAKLINKDFSLFYVNWSSNEYINQKKIKTEQIGWQTSQNTFKPQINQKSAKIFNEYRRKIQSSCNKFLDKIF